MIGAISHGLEYPSQDYAPHGGGLRFLSLFSGIEAASLAFKPLGWECVGVSEIEPFPCALLKYYYPTVPNLGDVTTITREQVEALGPIDLVVGGFPCTDLSIAGKRKGLRNEDGSATRSGLFFDAMRVVRHARPRFLLLENVPGLYTSNGGRDFAAVVGEILGVEFGVPRDGWANTGAAASERGLVEWSTLDAQWFGVPQRRRRVFALADFGDWTSRPPILLEPEGLCGDSPPSREAWERITGSLAARTNGGGGLGTDFDCDGGLVASTGDIANCLNAGGMGRIDAETETMVVCATGDVTHILKADGFDASEDGTARGVPTIAFNCDARVEELKFDPYLTAPLTTGQRSAIAYRSRPTDGDPCHPLTAHGHAPTLAFQSSQSGVRIGDVHATLDSNNGSRRHNGVIDGWQVRRLTVLECERLMGVGDNHTDITYRGKSTADGPRYRALGNSFAVPVVRWIGQQIQKVL